MDGDNVNLPRQFEDRMRELLGEEYEEYVQSYNKPFHVGLRVNTLKISPKEFEHLCPFSIKKIPWVSNGYYYKNNEQPARHPYYHAGLYYIQEPSAMVPASLLPIEPGDKVLDLCAAPGGKTTELGAKLKGDGFLVANDISISRAKALLKNIELFGISNALVLSESPDKLAKYFPETFDKILVDAPCSGEGMFRKSSSVMKNWEENSSHYYSKLQKEIILYAIKMLKPGGMILYSTCTFSPEENEGTISYLLEECPDIHVVEAFSSNEERRGLGIDFDGFDHGKPEWANGSHELKHTIRLWPHKIDGEGHFIALLQKERINDTESGSSTDDFVRYHKSESKTNSLSEEAIDFLSQIGTFKNIDDLIRQDRILIMEDRVYLVPKGFIQHKGLRTLRQGLLLGEMKKRRFIPSQALALALKSSDYNSLIDFSSEDSDVIRYLKCETLSLDCNNRNGWQLVCVDGFPLGWGKLNKGILKNMYQARWRWM